MKKLWLMSLALLLVISLGALGCPPADEPPAPPVAPTVELESIEVANLHALDEEFPADSARVRGFMDLATVLNITNPNAYPMMLDDVMFTLALEAAPGVLLELHTPIYYEDMWIPAKMTNQVRVEALFDSRTVFLALLVAHGITVEELGLAPADLIKTWWAEIGEFKYVIEVRAGMATFVTPDGEIVRSSFSGSWGATR
ncbi:hypothetical protein M1O53_01780 [Dehalococcoidia bacterium]|nr:hypothetical protein [Dehalococcoidia bacterium]